MKNLFFLMLIFVASCSQNKSPNASNLSFNADEDVIQIAPLTVTTPGTGIIPVTEMDFGVLAHGAKSNQDLIIHNNSSSQSVTYTAQDFDSSWLY